ncbi:MAG: hypothetical protein ACTS5I_14890, partial [Rhodanobacter sp.]
MIPNLLLKPAPLLAALLALSACSSSHDAPSAPAEPASAATAPATVAADNSPVVKEAFITASAEQDNIDSVASWHAPDGSARLYATAKQADAVRVYDAETGKSIGSIGTPGSGAGQLSRPNGISVIDDRLFVVERDNHRVQVFALPGGEPLGSFGDDVLKKPYGLWVRPIDGGYDVDVTDDLADLLDRETLLAVGAVADHAELVVGENPREGGDAQHRALAGSEIAERHGGGQQQHD